MPWKSCPLPTWLKLMIVDLIKKALEDAGMLITADSVSGPIKVD